jgi:hypothetical protein
MEDEDEDWGDYYDEDDDDRPHSPPKSLFPPTWLQLLLLTFLLTEIPTLVLNLNLCPTLMPATDLSRRGCLTLTDSIWAYVAVCIGSEELESGGEGDREEHTSADCGTLQLNMLRACLTPTTNPILPRSESWSGLCM